METSLDSLMQLGPTSGHDGTAIATMPIQAVRTQDRRRSMSVLLLQKEFSAPGNFTPLSLSMPLGYGKIRLRKGRQA
jgi:hypothetical protein